MLSAVDATADALVGVGGPFAVLTVTSVELAEEVVRPVAESLADIVAVDPAEALTGIDTSPVALTSPALVLDELNVSFEAGSTLIVPSL